MFQNINVRKEKISFKTRNNLLVILQNQIYPANRGIGVKLTSGEYRYSKIVNKMHRKKEQS